MRLPPSCVNATPPSEGPPTIASLVPSVMLNSDGPTTLRVLGLNFVEESVVLINGQDQATTFVSATELTTIYDPETGSLVDVSVSVRNPDGEFSNVMEIDIQAPPPVLTSITPNPVDIPLSTEATQGIEVTFQFVGSGFTPLTWAADTNSGNSLPTTYVSDTELSVGIEPEMLGPGTWPHFVVNLGEPSNELPLTFNTLPDPTITSITPNTVPAGVSTTLAVVGTGFMWRTSLRPADGEITGGATTNDATSLTASINVPTPGVYEYVLDNGWENGGVSAPYTITVTA